MADHAGADAPAKYFFEIGYFAAYADAIVRFGVAPYGVTDAIVDKAWQDAREGTADPAEFDRMRDQADASRSGRPVAHSVGGDAVREAQEIICDLMECAGFWRAGSQATLKRAENYLTTPLHTDGGNMPLREAVQHLLDVGEFCRTDDTESALRKVRAALAKHGGAEG